MINKLQLPFPDIRYPFNISYNDKLFLIGSCFSNNLGNKLNHLLFDTLINPSGVLFDPNSIVENLTMYLNNTPINDAVIFKHHDLYYSYLHHNSIAYNDKNKLIDTINNITQQAHHHLKQSNYLIITLGSAFAYYHKEAKLLVANCHKLNQNVFEKRLLDAASIEQMYIQFCQLLKQINPECKIIFTISPVRHIRDSLIQNNRSKAQLLSAVHSMIEKYPTDMYYFPSYEMIIDVLRDYRFFDVDLVHPNYLATNILFDFFCQHYFDLNTQKIAEKINQIQTSISHIPIHPQSNAHQQFIKDVKEKINQLYLDYPFLKSRKLLTI